MNRIGRRTLIAMGVILVIAVIAFALKHAPRCPQEAKENLRIGSVKIADAILISGCP